MVYSVVTWDRFHDDLLKVPKEIAKKANLATEYIKKNPQDRSDLRKLKGANYLYRKRIGKNYRLILFIKRQEIKILLLIIRKKDIYDLNLLKHLERKAVTNSNFLESKTISDCKNREKSEIAKNKERLKEDKFLFTKDKLKNLKIPQKYWSELLKFNCNQKDEIDRAKIPDEYLALAIEYLFPPENKQPVLKIEQLKYQTEYDYNYDRTNDLIEGKIKLSAYKQSSLQLDEVQKKYCTLGLNNRDFGFAEALRDRQSAILLKGAAGTGKSLIAFYRIKKLVEAGYQRILYVTYNKTLANYALQIVTAMLGKIPQEVGVSILTVNEIVSKYYLQKYPQPKIADNYNQLDCLKQAISTVKIPSKDLKEKLSRLGDKYLLDEFLKVIESQEITSFEEYKVIKRTGRKTKFGKQERKGIWHIYVRWKKIIAEELNYEIQEWVNLKTLNLIRNKTIDTDFYDSIVIDEAQDLSPVVFNILILLANSPTNIFLTADTSQSLYQKVFCWQSIQKTLSFNYSSYILQNSYRSSQYIQKACQAILANSQSKDEFIDSNSLSAKPCNKLGKKPTILLTDKLENITNETIRFLEKSSSLYNIPIQEGAIISHHYPDTFQKIIIRALQEKGLNTKLFDRDSLNASNNCVKALNMYDAKGLEFPFVVIVGLSQRTLPREEFTNLNSEERSEMINQQRRLFYVACTRATKALLVIGSNSNRSEFLPLLNNSHWNKKIIS